MQIGFTVNATKSVKRSGQERTIIVLIVLSILVSTQTLFTCNLLEFTPTRNYSTTTASISSLDAKQEGPKEKGKRQRQRDATAPMWSTFRRQRSKNLPEFDAPLIWKWPGVKAKVKPQRIVTEVMVYGLAGVLPWFGTILPAIRFELPFSNTTKIEMVRVNNITDIFVDLQQCSEGRNETSGPDGYYDVCFPNVTGGSAAKEMCYQKGINMRSTTRIRKYPAPGHERWSCSDEFVIEQLAAAQVLDYIIRHGDRFYRDRTNNLFFSANERPVQFLSIDHDTDPCRFFRYQEYEETVSMKMLLEYDLPLDLRDDLRRVVLRGSKDDFLQTFNSTIDGQYDNLNRVSRESFTKDYCKPGKEDPRDLADIIWERLESVVHFYNITIDD